MKAQVYNIKAEKVGEITLPKAIFEAKVSEQLIAQSIRVHLNNKRSAFAKTKTRSEVIGTTKKVWAQKGTGRARHGSEKAPVFVGGGSAHGPRGAQSYSLNLTKRMKKVAMNSVLTKFATKGRILVLDQVSSMTPKTKEAIKLIAGLRKDNEVLSTSSKVCIITSKPLDNVKRAFGNLEKTNLFNLKSLNVYDLSNQNYLIFSKKAIKHLSK